MKPQIDAQYDTYLVPRLVPRLVRLCLSCAHPCSTCDRQSRYVAGTLYDVLYFVAERDSVRNARERWKFELK